VFTFTAPTYSTHLTYSIYPTYFTYFAYFAYSTTLSSAMKLGDPELHLPPTYDLDQKVRVTKKIRNDGTFPGEPTGKPLVEPGEEGYVIGVGTYLQTAYIYSVHFLGSNRIVGCLGLELEPAEDLSKPRA